jgi:type IV secretory pathway TrbL component
MKQSRWTTLTAGIVLAAATAGSTSTEAFAQTAQTAKTEKAAPSENSASMVKPPETASGSGGSSNPDNMPIKRPRKPTNDRMMHEPPASGANAK